MHVLELLFFLKMLNIYKGDWVKFSVGVVKVGVCKVVEFHF